MGTWISDKNGWILIKDEWCPFCLESKTPKAKTCNKCKSKAKLIKNYKDESNESPSSEIPNS